MRFRHRVMALMVIPKGRIVCFAVGKMKEVSEICRAREMIHFCRVTPSHVLSKQSL